MKRFGKLFMIGIFYDNILVTFVVVVVVIIIVFLLPFWPTFLSTVSAAVVNFISIHFSSELFNEDFATKGGVVYACLRATGASRFSKISMLMCFFTTNY